MRERYTALAEGAGIIGSVQTRNLATLGGNVCNAAPSADTTPPLVVLDAVAEVVGAERFRVRCRSRGCSPGRARQRSRRRRNSRRLPAACALAAYGQRTTSETHAAQDHGHRCGRRGSIRLTLANKSGDTIDEARICLGAVAPRVIHATEAEAGAGGALAPGATSSSPENGGARRRRQRGQSPMCAAQRSSAATWCG